MWTIQATAIHKTEKGDRAISIPTFFLDENVQGILNEGHAIAIAESIINPLKLVNLEVCITALLS